MSVDPAPVLVRTYLGKNQQEAAARMTADAPHMTSQRYRPAAQSWAPGGYSGAAKVLFVVAAIAVLLALFVPARSSAGVMGNVVIFGGAALVCLLIGLTSRRKGQLVVTWAR